MNHNANMRDVFGEDWRAKFVQATESGDITRRAHPEFDGLVIANYTPQCAYAGHWNDVTMASRGLIFDWYSGKIFARPFAKFFNYGQAEAPSIDFDKQLYHVSNKYDGSLGIGYVRPDGKFAIATRGSFASEQAQHASKLVRDKLDDYIWYRGDSFAGYTPLFEIIYPENRIVLDYGQQDYLQFLGWVANHDGKYIPPGTELMEPTTFSDVLAREPRKNAEGWVVWLDSKTAVKIKQEDYVALHAVVTNLSEKAVWEVARTENVQQWAEFVAALPDELQSWATSIRDDKLASVRHYERLIYRVFDRVSSDAWDDAGQPDGGTPRAIFAARVAQEPAEYRPYLFSILDGKNYIIKLWDRVKPVGLGVRPGGSVDAD